MLTFGSGVELRMSTSGSHVLNFVLDHYGCGHPIQAIKLRMSTSGSHFFEFSLWR